MSAFYSSDRIKSCYTFIDSSVSLLMVCSWAVAVDTDVILSTVCSRDWLCPSRIVIESAPWLWGKQSWLRVMCSSRIERSLSLGMPQIIVPHLRRLAHPCAIDAWHGTLHGRHPQNTSLTMVCPGDTLPSHICENYPRQSTAPWHQTQAWTDYRSSGTIPYR